MSGRRGVKGSFFANYACDGAATTRLSIAKPKVRVLEETRRRRVSETPPEARVRIFSLPVVVSCKIYVRRCDENLWGAEVQ